MPNCAMCGQEFNRTIIVDGIKRRSNRRKYCYSCTPFDQNNKSANHIIEGFVDTRSIYTENVLRQAAASSMNVLGVMKYLNIPYSGRMHTYISRKIVLFGIDTSHFTGIASNRGKHHKGGARKPSTSDILSVWDRDNKFRTHQVRGALIEIGIPYLCSICGIKPEWNGKKLTLQIDHRDGIKIHNTEDNIRFVCPNCHSQTENYAGRGAKGKHLAPLA